MVARQLLGQSVLLPECCYVVARALLGSQK